MQLNSITLENFRQYYGEQTIKFAKEDKNITIIFGENGKGKTGIFRALMFGFFGTVYLNQDNKNDDIHLVNFLKIEESGRPITSKVKVDFEHNDKRYIIIREIIGYKLGDKIKEKIGVPKLYFIDENGNYSAEPIEDEVKIKSIVNKIIDEKIKDFFLFDAERIDTLAKTDASVKSEVKTIIIKLLQIETLNDVITILNDLYNKEKRNYLSKSSNIDLKNAEAKIKRIKEEKKNLEEKVYIKNDNISSCNNEINAINEKLAENSEIRAIQKEVKAINETRAYKIENLNLLKESLKESSFNRSHMLLMEDYYYIVKDYLNQIVIDQKDLIPYEIIEKSIKEMFCSCCKTDLSKYENAFKEIVKLKDNYKRSELTPLITEIAGSIMEFLDEKNEIKNTIKDKLKAIQETKDEIEYLEVSINSYNAEISKFSKTEENLSQLEKTLVTKKQDKSNLIIEINKIEIEIECLDKELREAIMGFEKLQNADDSLKNDKKKIEYIKTLKESLDKILSEYSDDMRNKLMEETTNIFKILIDKKDELLIKNIVINDKYEIEIYNSLGTKMTQDISQGQRQIVALSFITALAKVAAGGIENIDFPLFMDTPFGRVSGNNRDNLIENIPNLTSQWILLLTDTEFTVHEEMKLKQGNKLGKWYKLDQAKEYQTNIVEIDVNDTMATRR